MARYSFGTNETLKCFDEIKPFNIEAKEGRRNVCFASKIKADYLVLPWRTYVDDYVLKVTDSTSYYEIDRSLIQYHQEQGNLPETLPRHSFTILESLGGYSLWIVLLLVLLGSLKDILFKNDDSKTSEDNTEVNDETK
mgnify:FL=1